MKAVRIERPGGPEVLQYVDVPTPEPGPHEVLVRTVAAGVGMPDVLVRRGVYAWMPQLPAILGIETAGVIERVGSAVAHLAAGQPVYVNARDLPERSGGYAEYRLAPADAVHLLAPGADLVRAAALGNYQVAEALLRMGSAFPAPQSVAVFGAAGGVGSAAVQLARARGWRVVALAGSAEKCRFAREQGADHAIDYRSTDAAAAIRDCTRGAGVDLVLDMVAGDAVPALFGALAPLGVVVSFGFVQGEPSPATVPAMRKRFGHSPAWRLFSMHSFDALPALRHDVMRAVLAAFAAGTIVPHIHRTFALEDAQAAHRLFEAKTQMGKLILAP